MLRRPLPPVILFVLPVTSLTTTVTVTNAPHRRSATQAQRRAMTAPQTLIPHPTTPPAFPVMLARLNPAEELDALLAARVASSMMSARKNARNVKVASTPMPARHRVRRALQERFPILSQTTVSRVHLGLLRRLYVSISSFLSRLTAKSMTGCIEMRTHLHRR
jgi:hypothetical protein